MQKFLEPDGKPKVIYTDNSLEFGKACEDLSWDHCTSTPHRSETNGIAERAVRRVKEGTSAILLQSGLDENWWTDSMECKTYLQNIQDLLSDGKTSHEKRFGKPCKGRSLRLVHWLSISQFLRKTSQESINLGKKVLPGMFLGYALYGARIWKGDVTVADIEELETMEIYSERHNAQEVIFPTENGKFIFPVADGRIKFVWGDQELRTSTLIREHPIGGEGHVDFLGESVGSLPPPPSQDSLPDVAEAINVFLVHVRKLHIQSSRWTQSQTLLVERRILRRSTEIHSCVQNCKHKFGCETRTPHRRLWEYRWVKRFVWFLDRFHSVYSIGRETSRRIFVVWVVTDKTADDTHTRSFMARTLDQNGKKC